MSNDLHALYKLQSDQIGNTGEGVRSFDPYSVDSPKLPNCYVSNRMAPAFIARPDSCLVSL